MTYKPTHFVVEVHIGLDVFAKDYGPERGCAERAIARLIALSSIGDAKFNELRIWHNGKCILQGELTP